MPRSARITPSFKSPAHYTAQTLVDWKQPLTTTQPPSATPATRLAVTQTHTVRHSYRSLAHASERASQGETESLCDGMGCDTTAAMWEGKEGHGTSGGITMLLSTR